MLIERLGRADANALYCTARASHTITLPTSTGGGGCSVLFIFVIAGSLYVNSDNWHPFVPQAQNLGQFGFFGIMRGSAVVFFSYIGFDSISTAAQVRGLSKRERLVCLYHVVGVFFPRIESFPLALQPPIPPAPSRYFLSVRRQRTPSGRCPSLSSRPC